MKCRSRSLGQNCMLEKYVWDNLRITMQCLTLTAITAEFLIDERMNEGSTGQMEV